MRIIAVLLGGLVLSTALLAIEPEDNPHSKFSHKVDQKKSSGELLRLLRTMHNCNTVFDDYSLGGTCGVLEKPIKEK